MRVRDDPRQPDPGFADLYAALPEPRDLWPWLEWCRSAEPPVLYLGIGAGRLAAPLHRAGIELVGVDAHPAMLAHARRRIPGIELHQALLEDLRLRRRFGLVIAPSSILTDEVNLAAAVRHARAGGRIGMELMNPYWLTHGGHEGVRVAGRRLEVDYRLPDGSVFTQVVDDIAATALPPETTESRLARHGLRLEWMGSSAEHDHLVDSATYFVLAMKSRRTKRNPGAV